MDVDIKLLFFGQAQDFRYMPSSRALALGLVHKLSSSYVNKSEEENLTVL